MKIARAGCTSGFLDFYYTIDESRKVRYQSQKKKGWKKDTEQMRDVRVCVCVCVCVWTGNRSLRE